MSERETTTTQPLGWPRTGELSVHDGRPRIAVEYGAGVRDWADDAAWARACSTAWATAAAVLEAERDRQIVDGQGPDRSAGREAAPGETTTFPTVEPAPVLAAPTPELVLVTPPLSAGVVPFETECPARCGRKVYPGANGPVHLVEGGTVAACRPPVSEDPAPTRVLPTIEGQVR
jgi:hypothetical protein